MYITCAWGHIDNEIIQVIPINISYKLTNGAACHGSSPNHCILFIDEQSDTDQFNTVTLQWNNHSLAIHIDHHWPFAAHAKHDRHAWPINVSVHQPYFRVSFGKGERQVGSD